MTVKTKLRLKNTLKSLDIFKTLINQFKVNKNLWCILNYRFFYERILILHLTNPINKMSSSWTYCFNIRKKLINDMLLNFLRWITQRGSKDESLSPSLYGMAIVNYLSNLNTLVRKMRTNNFISSISIVLWGSPRNFMHRKTVKSCTLLVSVLIICLLFWIVITYILCPSRYCGVIINMLFVLAFGTYYFFINTERLKYYWPVFS